MRVTRSEITVPGGGMQDRTLMLAWQPCPKRLRPEPILWKDLAGTETIPKIVSRSIIILLPDLAINAFNLCCFNQCVQSMLLRLIEDVEAVSHSMRNEDRSDNELPSIRKSSTSQQVSDVMKIAGQEPVTTMQNLSTA